jgi:Bacterial Ig-like domain/Bacterial Ig domain
MRFARRMLPGGVLSVLVACGSDVTGPGALTLTLNGPPPSVTDAAAFPISGQVTRTPAAADQIVVVTATGGLNAVSDTAAADGAFALSVTLALNAENNLSITASDQSGSTSTPVNLTVRHDNQPPQISTMTPAHESDEVTPATVSIEFNEPVQPGTAALTVSVQGVAVLGATALSTDSLILTFTPSTALPPNAIHVVSVSAQDRLGNALLNGIQCFATGGDGISVFTDPGGDIFTFGSPAPTLVPPDLRELRFARDATLWHLLLEFAAARSPSASAAGNLLTAIDFDMDQDDATGTITVKDTLYSGILAPSGARAEYAVFLRSVGTAADSSAVGSYVEPFTIDPTFLFVPGFCGKLVGVSVPAAAFGDDDGAFNAVALHVAFNLSGDGSTLEDPTPETGFYAVSLAGASVLGATTPYSGPAGEYAGPVRLRVPVRSRQ